jgi:hypothetical protein
MAVRFFQERAVLDKCQHSVYVVPSDWQAQAAHGIPPARRIAWYCWICRDFEAYRFSVEKLLELARANRERKAWPVRKPDAAVLEKNADDGDDGALAEEEALDEQGEADEAALVAE